MLKEMIRNKGFKIDISLWRVFSGHSSPSFAPRPAFLAEINVDIEKKYKTYWCIDGMAVFLTNGEICAKC